MGRIAEAFQGLLAGYEGLVEWSVKSEEFYLYPVRQLFFGELCDKRLLDGHEGIFRSVRKIADLTKIKSWTDA